jgi:hypothetical protein
VEDPNRRDGITNIPNSVNVPFSVTATLTIDVSGPNSSPRFNASQTDQAYTWSTLVHDPQAFDPDGDSLSFELMPCLGSDMGGDGTPDPIAGYLMPEEIGSSTSDYSWVDPSTGVFLWDQPNMLGSFQIAIKCTQWRNGMAIGDVTRDMSLCVWQLPTGIHDAANAGAPWLFPEGSAGHYHVDPQLADGSVTVLDGSGRVVKQSSARETIDLSALGDGVYSVVIRNAEGTVVTTRVALVR